MTIKKKEINSLYNPPQAKHKVGAPGSLNKPNVEDIPYLESPPPIPEECLIKKLPAKSSDSLDKVLSKYVFKFTDQSENSLFSTTHNGNGKIVISINSSHPCYTFFLKDVLNPSIFSNGRTPIDEFDKSTISILLLLSSWADYEYSQPEGKLKKQAQKVRSDWGYLLSELLEN